MVIIRVSFGGVGGSTHLTPPPLPRVATNHNMHNTCGCKKNLNGNTYAIFMINIL